MYDYYIILNGNAYQQNEQKLPNGTWELLADHEIASPLKPSNFVSGSVNLPAQSGILLRKLRH
jgi:hypothetical protein